MILAITVLVLVSQIVFEVDSSRHKAACNICHISGFLVSSSVVRSVNHDPVYAVIGEQWGFEADELIPSFGSPCSSTRVFLSQFFKYGLQSCSGPSLAGSAMRVRFRFSSEHPHLLNKGS